jgi:hypothetical protein
VNADAEYRLKLTPELSLSVDPQHLYLESAGSKAQLSVAYGSSRSGWADAIDHATLGPGGSVILHYRTFCEPSGLEQTTSLAALRATLLMAQAEKMPPSAARPLIEQANTLAPTEPAAAVARAALEGSSTARQNALLAPAFAAAPFDTYFELLQAAPQLQELTVARKQRSAVAGNARLEDADRFQATSGNLLALVVSAETEADCSSTDELVILDARSAAVVFRHAFLERDGECHEQRQSVAPLNQLLRDLGFNRSQGANAASSDLDQYRFDFEDGQNLVIARDGHAAHWTALNGALYTTYWPTLESPRRAQLLPSLHTLVIETNRDSDVCEGLPSFELLPAP